MHSAGSFTEALRLAELQSAIEHLKPGSSLLEIGAGTGWQARELARLGFQVEAVDISDGTYTAGRIWPVRDYDGRNLPFPDATFDAVFSSNVLEHIDRVHEHLVEQVRVLKPGGSMIHVVPTPTWRFWTSLTYYPAVLLRRLRRRAASGTNADQSASPVSARRNRLSVLWAPAHGTDTSPIREIWTFSRFRWLGEFSRLPVAQVEHSRAGLFYSGYLLFGARLSLQVRRGLARVLGSSCRVFSMLKR